MDNSVKIVDNFEKTAKNPDFTGIEAVDNFFAPLWKTAKRSEFCKKGEKNERNGKMKRILTVLLAVAMLFSFAACVNESTTDEPSPAPSSPSASEGSEASKESGKTDSVLDQPEDAVYGKTVLTVDGYEISYGIYRYYYHLVAASMMGSNKNYFTEHPEELEKLREETLEQCKVVAAYFNMGKDAEAKLPTDEALDTEFKEYIAEYEPMYPLYYGVTMAEYLKGNHLSLSAYKVIFTLNNYLSEAIYNYLGKEGNELVDLSDAALEEALKDYRCVKHILVGHEDGLEDAEALALATDLAKQLREGGDIDALMKEYSNDYQENGQNAYTFTYGEMVKEFEEAAFNMEVGEVTDPVKSTYGYHVIVRLEIDKEAFKKAEFTDIAINKAFFDFAKAQNVTETADFAQLCTHEKLMAD